MPKLLSLLILLTAGACCDTAGAPDASKAPEARQTTELEQMPLLMPLSIVPARKRESFEISYMPRGTAMLVNGKVNGTPVQFVVDTGASFVVISPEIAERAGIETDRNRSIKLQTANGIITVPLVTIDSVIADDIEIGRVDAVIHNATGDPGIGLLGMSFFGDHKITINHGTHTILLEQK